MKVMSRAGGPVMEAFLYNGKNLPEGADPTKARDRHGNQLDVGDYVVISPGGTLQVYDRGQFKTNFVVVGKAEVKEEEKVIRHPHRHIDLSKGKPDTEKPKKVSRSRKTKKK